MEVWEEHIHALTVARKMPSKNQNAQQDKHIFMKSKQTGNKAAKCEPAACGTGKEHRGSEDRQALVFMQNSTNSPLCAVFILSFIKN